MDSNHRPLPCQGSALDQLSYGPVVSRFYDVFGDPRNFIGRVVNSFATKFTVSVSAHNRDEKAAELRSAGQPGCGPPREFFAAIFP
jgi:hypothetical protein